VIVFDLRCDGAHAFEAWFANSSAFEDQRSAGQILCPFCASTHVTKAMMAPRLGTRGNRSAETSIAEALPKLAALQAAMLKKSQWVGNDFADQARAMSDGEAIPATIHGTATIAQARALHEDGIGILPLIFPVVPPKKVN